MRGHGKGESLSQLPTAEARGLVKSHTTVNFSLASLFLHEKSFSGPFPAGAPSRRGEATQQNG